MHYQELFENIIRDLKQEIRPQLKLTKSEISEVIGSWNGLLSNWNKDKETDLKKILCIVDHSQTLSRDFTAPIIQTLKLDLPTDLIIYAIASAQKHIITKSAIEGVHVPAEFIKVLKKLLDSKEPEIFEWVLRAIESMGNQSLKFKEVVLKKKPSFFATFNKHMKAAKGIIQILEKRWEIFK